MKFNNTVCYFENIWTADFDMGMKINDQISKKAA